MGMDISSGSKKKGRHSPEMNVTPLVDVVLVLLIIFMVITPMMSKQFWVNLPNKPKDEQVAAATSGDQPLVVSVQSDGKVRINKDVVSDDYFVEKLRRVLVAKGARKVFFDAQNDTEYGRAMRVLDMARLGGAAKIAVMTTPLKE